MLARGIGDNSAAFGEDLREDIETVLSDDHEATFRYAQWHIGDYITGTMGMQLEQEGAYIRFLMRLYQRGKPLPDDDRFMAMCMNLSIRVWKRVRDGLVAVGKIIARAGCLTNARFEKERQQRAEMMRKQAEAARLRWQRQRAEKMGLAEVSPKFGESLDETSPKLSEFIAKKPNEISASPITSNMLTINQYPLTIDNNPPTVPPRGDGAPKRKKTPVPEEYSKSFEAFWEIYPRKIAKGAASNAWQRLSLEQQRRAYRALKDQLPGLRSQVRPDGNFCPHPATWINEGRFDDEPAAAMATPKARPSFLDSVIVPETKPRPADEVF